MCVTVCPSVCLAKGRHWSLCILAYNSWTVGCTVQSIVWFLGSWVTLYRDLSVPTFCPNRTNPLAHVMCHLSYCTSFHIPYWLVRLSKSVWEGPTIPIKMRTLSCLLHTFEGPLHIARVQSDLTFCKWVWRVSKCVVLSDRVGPTAHLLSIPICIIYIS